MPNLSNANKKVILVISLAIGLALVGLLIFGFSSGWFTPQQVTATRIVTPQPPTPTPTVALEPYMTYEIVNAYPHDPKAFTQGLLYADGYFYESTGLYGESSLRKVAIESGDVLEQYNLPHEFFAEGLTLWQDQLIQLTWRENTGFVYDQEDFSLIGDFSYETEGWGLTHDGTNLIMSDGSPALYFLDPHSFETVNQVAVTFQGEEVERINELEYINGEIFANIWQTDQIIRIDPQSGEVLGFIDLCGILPESERTPETDVLNGIAYDPENDRLFITGKSWPYVYEVRLVPAE